MGIYRCSVVLHGKSWHSSKEEMCSDKSAASLNWLQHGRSSCLLLMSSAKVRWVITPIGCHFLVPVQRKRGVWRPASSDTLTRLEIILQLSLLGCASYMKAQVYSRITRWWFEMLTDDWELLLHIQKLQGCLVGCCKLIIVFNWKIYRINISYEQDDSYESPVNSLVYLCWHHYKKRDKLLWWPMCHKPSEPSAGTS